MPDSIRSSKLLQFPAENTQSPPSSERFYWLEFLAQEGRPDREPINFSAATRTRAFDTMRKLLGLSGTGQLTVKKFREVGGKRFCFGNEQLFPRARKKSPTKTARITEVTISLPPGLFLPGLDVVKLLQLQKFLKELGGFFPRNTVLAERERITREYTDQELVSLVNDFTPEKVKEHPLFYAVVSAELNRRPTQRKSNLHRVK